MDINVDDLLKTIGRQTVTIDALNAMVNRLGQEIKRLKEKDEQKDKAQKEPEPES